MYDGARQKSKKVRPFLLFISTLSYTFGQKIKTTTKSVKRAIHFRHLSGRKAPLQHSSLKIIYCAVTKRSVSSAMASSSLVGMTKAEIRLASVVILTAWPRRALD